MNPTDTPRTDALGYIPTDIGHCWPLVQHARELERELSAERALADRLAHWLSSLECEELVPAEWDASVTKALAAWKEARRE